MALKNQPEFEAPETEAETEAETATTTKQKDETMTTATASVAAASVAAASVAAASVAAASVAATTAIAKAATTGVAVPSKLKLSFSDKQAVFDTSTVEGLGMAVPRLKGEQGSIFQNEDDLGDSIHIEVVSINPRWVIGTGTQDAEAKEYFRVSYDNHVISGETTLVEDYINDLKAQGFDKVKKSEYLDIFGFVTWTAKKGEVEVEKRELACLQCAPTSKGAFLAFATTRGLLESRGVARPLEVIGVRAMKRISGSNKFTNFEFFAPPSK